jgi:hypothetical protein
MQFLALNLVPRSFTATFFKHPVDAHENENENENEADR